MQSETIKLIRTATGTKTKKDFFKDNLGSCNFVLPYEHVCQNLCKFLSKPSDYFKQDDEISLENISDISQNIFSSYKNLYLETDTIKNAYEISQLKPFKCVLIVDATTKSNGQNINAMRHISKFSGVEICFGYSLKFDLYDSESDNFDNNFNFDKILSEIRYEIAYGYDDLIPSFLGEFIISNSDVFPNQREENLYNILFKVIDEFRIPIYLKLNFSSCKNSKVFEYFDEKCKIFPNIDRKLVIFVLSTNEDSDFVIDNILNNGFSLIICLYDCDLVRVKLNSDNDTDCLNFLPDYFSDSKLNFIVSLITAENKKFIQQIMISNNINFRIQLKKYGGFGYANLFKNYFNKIINLSELNTNDICRLFSENLINLLSYWEPPKNSEKKVKHVTCTK